MIRSALVVFALTLFSAGAQAQVYKCVDATGRTVYSQTACPRGEKSKTLDANPAPASASPAPSFDASKADAQFRKRELEQQEAAKKGEQEAEKAKEKKDNCDRARSSLAQYEAGGRISRYTPSGERQFLTDDEIAQEKTRAESLVQQYCK